MLGTAARVALLLVSVAIALVATGAASADPVVGDCQNSSKLIGRIELSTEDSPGTWWNLTREGLDDAGVTEYEEFIEGIFGTEFGSLGAAVEALVDAVRPLDKNGNGYVCATSATGTKAFVGDPNYAYYYFGVIDDKHDKG